MQYHLNGYLSGDPSVGEANDNAELSVGSTDVLIVGCGPAGLTLAAQLSAFPEVRTRIVERKSGPLEVGQADGVACRSVEMFEAFSFAEKVLKESYWVNEVAFWRPGEDGAGLARVDRIQDVEDGLSEMPHVILNQARVHDFYLEVMRNSPHRLEPEYEKSLVAITRDDAEKYPLAATLQSKDGETETIKAKYIVGCDGARSAVRKHMGAELKGEAARQLWGVMDVLVVTDFPDLRLKAAIQSAEHGSILIIPREGGYMVRLYIELDELADGERASDRNVTSEMLIEKAGAILSPYTLEVKEVAWWSAYEIVQRVCDVFDDRGGLRGDQTPRIFIAGDACHTHSPKAGQGMNVSMADTFNLGWKLAAVIRGQSASELLSTYSEERRAKAKELIDFDKDMARLFSAKPETPEEAVQFQRYFQKHGRYTAGVETCYEPSLITSANARQHLAAGYKVGMRFHSAPVTRLGDAKPMQLGHALKADGRWRLIAFAPSGDQGGADGKITRLCEYLENNAASPIHLYTPADDDIDAVFDLRVVFQQPHRSMDLGILPRLLLPRKGRYGLIDYEKAFCPDLSNGNDIFDMRAVDRKEGALVIVRPDQYVANITLLDAYDDITDFFAGFMKAA